MKKIVIPALALVVLLAPLAFAQNFSYAENWITRIIDWTQRAVTFLMVIATLYFIWTVIQYIREKDAKEVVNKKNAMIRGIIGLAVIVGIWGIVNILTNTFGVGQGGSAPVPCPPGQRYYQNIGCR